MALTFEETSWLASCWAITGILGCFAGGIISDLMGRRMVLILSVIPFAAGNILIGFSSNLWQVLLSRCLVGLGDGMMYPNLLGKPTSALIQFYHFNIFSLCSRDS